MRVFLQQLALLCSFWSVASTHPEKIQWYIANGNNASPNEFPWMALIVNGKGELSCGATLITTRHVLTAAHCVNGEQANNPTGIKVRLGVYAISEPLRDDQKFKVKLITHHPGYNSDYDYDYVILELEKEIVKDSKKSQICLAQKPPSTGQSVTVLGWGLTEKGSTSDILQIASLKVWDTDRCKRSYFNKDISGPILCAGTNDDAYRKNTCQFDSGGPLMWRDSNSNWLLGGITSFGYGPCGADPGFYYSVTEPTIYNWISQNIAPNELCQN